MTTVLSPVCQRVLRVALACTVTLIPTACGEDAVTSPPPPVDNSAVDAELRALPPWGEFSPSIPPSNTAIGPDSAFRELFEDVLYECSSQMFELSETPDKIVTFDPDANILWLGALLQGRGYVDGIGSLREVPVRQRAPVIVTVDLLSGNNTRTVADPSAATVGRAIGEMVQAAADAGVKAGSAISFSYESTHSVQQAALALGLSASYMGASVVANLDASRSRAERTVTAHFVQRMFTVSMVLPQSPGAVFSDEFTMERLQEQRDLGTIGSDNLPVYVANVVYGRILTFSFTSTADEASIRRAISASFSAPTGDSVGGGISGELMQILNEAKINVVAVGGEGRNALALIQTGRLQDYFTEDAALTSAKPISYTVRNLGDNSIATVSETTVYDLTECRALPSTGTLEIDVNPNSADVKVVGAGNYKMEFTGDQILRELQPGGYSITLIINEKKDTLPPVETEVFAGETTREEVFATDPRGAVYNVGFHYFILHELPASCIGAFDGDPEVYYSFFLGGNPVREVGPENAVKREEGSFVPINASKQISLLVGDPAVNVTGFIRDVDDDADDIIANFNNFFGTATTFPPIPTEGYRTYEARFNGCYTTLTISVFKVRNIF